jgi:lactoylglutathione lyase
MGLEELRRFQGTKADCTIVFLAAPGNDEAQIELVQYHNADECKAKGNFGHISYQVDNIYRTCRELMAQGLTLNMPPKDGFMAFVRSPDNISIELLQKGKPLPPQEPWLSMEESGEW